MQSLAKYIYFRLMGWSLEGCFPKLRKCVIVVAPHTSWVDFLLGLLVRRVLNLEIHYIAKKSLFRPPFGWYFKWMNGTPIDRSQTSDTVAAIAQLFKDRDTFRLALSPEGTRKKVAQWKTGFYYIAKEAGVPIVLVAFDYGMKQVKISAPMVPTDSMHSDFKNYRDFYTGVNGRHTELGF